MDILLQGKKGFQTIIGYYLVVLSLGLYILEELCCVTQKKKILFRVLLQEEVQSVGNTSCSA